MPAVRPLSMVPDNVRTRSERETRSLYEAIRASIVNGELSPGSRLVTERVLCDLYRVGRNTVRKSMSRLMDEGLIVRTVGRGTFVADSAKTRAATEKLPAFSLAELLEARLLFEPALTELVVERATSSDFKACGAALRDMEKAASWETFKEAKYALHLAIVRASRNSFLIHTFENIVQARRATGWAREKSSASPGPLPSVRQHACRDQAAIIAALSARDGKLARELVRDYLVRTLASVNDA